MKEYIFILLTLLGIVACKPINPATPPSSTQNTITEDSLFVTADFRKHGDYYNTGHQVYAIDLLSEGLSYDSLFRIEGSGCNLFLSDIFSIADSLPSGHYTMDSLARDNTFLRGMYFEENITGTYLLVIDQNRIQRIILFTSGSMDVSYIDNDIHLNLTLYTSDSTRYHAIYQGPARYR